MSVATNICESEPASTRYWILLSFIPIMPVLIRQNTPGWPPSRRSRQLLPLNDTKPLLSLIEDLSYLRVSHVSSSIVGDCITHSVNTLQPGIPKDIKGQGPTALNATKSHSVTHIAEEKIFFVKGKLTSSYGDGNVGDLALWCV